MLIYIVGFSNITHGYYAILLYYITDNHERQTLNLPDLLQHKIVSVLVIQSYFLFLHKQS